MKGQKLNEPLRPLHYCQRRRWQNLKSTVIGHKPYVESAFGSGLGLGVVRGYKLDQRSPVPQGVFWIRCLTLGEIFVVLRNHPTAGQASILH